MLGFSQGSGELVCWCGWVRASASRGAVMVHGHGRPSRASADRGQPREIMMIVGSVTQFSYQTK